MKLLYESSPLLEKRIDESSGKKRMYIEGPFLMSNRKNRNGRVYPKPVMQESVDMYIRDYINESRASGELNHPPYPMPDPKKAAIMIESLEWQGDDVIGRAKVLNTEDGLIIQELLSEGFKLGVSSRGLGDLTTRGDTVTVNKFLLNAIDVVDLPSGQVCYVNPITESVEWVFEGGIWSPKQVDKPKIVTAESLIEGFEKFMYQVAKEAIRG